MGESVALLLFGAAMLVGAWFCRQRFAAIVIAASGLLALASAPFAVAEDLQAAGRAVCGVVWDKLGQRAGSAAG